MGRSRTRKGKARPRPKGDKVARAARRLSEAVSELVVETSKVIERPPVDASVIGHQAHFLRRLDRLSDRARELALRFYHDAALTRFVAQLALGRDPEAVLLTEGVEPEDPETMRVALALEPGLEPGKIIVDVKGKVVTCLAPGMPTGLRERVSHDFVLAAVQLAELSSAAHELIRKTAPAIDYAALTLRIGRRGWHTAREDLAQLYGLGRAGSAYLLFQHKESFLRTINAWKALTERPPHGHDKLLREWFTSCGELAAYLILLADLGVPPALDLLRGSLSLHEPVHAMILGACTTRWPRIDAELEIFCPTLQPDDPAARVDLFSVHFGLITHFGVLQRMFPRSCAPAGLYARIDEFMHTYHDYYDREYQLVRRLGLEQQPAVVLLRDLGLLARGQRPDWGDDLVDDPAELPPLCLADYCLDGAVESPRLIRNLAQRLFACARGPLFNIFDPREQIERWERRLGPLDQGRSGIFAAPWFNKEELPRPAAAAGRNDPCPCGSGKKYKKCCLAS